MPSSLPALTSRQQQILRLIARQLEQQGLPPTRGELAELLGLRNRQGIEQHLRALERKGYLALMPETSRGIRLLADPRGLPANRAPGHGASEGAESLPAAARLPLYGRVAAGLPTLASGNVEAELLIDASLFKPRADFLLRVRGESMIEADIHDQDILAVHRTSSVRNGQIVVARLGEEATVKVYQRSGHQLSLEPANALFEPIRVDLRRQPCHIEGLVVGIVRTGIPPVALKSGTEKRR
ncbi:MAG: transcriptional repressor LexA [Steroidobacteraceae bacterium]